MYTFEEVELPQLGQERRREDTGSRNRWWAFLRGDAYVNPFLDMNDGREERSETLKFQAYTLQPTGRQVSFGPEGITVTDREGEKVLTAYKEIYPLQLNTYILVRSGQGLDMHQLILNELRFEANGQRERAFLHIDRAVIADLRGNLMEWTDAILEHQPYKDKRSTPTDSSVTEYFSTTVYQLSPRKHSRRPPPKKSAPPPIRTAPAAPPRKLPPSAPPETPDDPPYEAQWVTEPGKTASEKQRIVIGSSGITVYGRNDIELFYSEVQQLQLGWYFVKRIDEVTGRLIDQQTYHELTYRSGDRAQTLYLPVSVQELSALRYKIERWAGARFLFVQEVTAEKELREGGILERHSRSLMILDER
jgi:hypothetical protein